MIRYLPDEPLPAVPYVPGKTARPLDVDDHDARGGELVSNDPPRLLLRGLDLFNHGYYWEAHEAWEELWHVEERRGLAADLLKGLIALAAAGVKARQGNAAGVSHHAERAAALFAKVRDMRADSRALQMRLPLAKLIGHAEALARSPIVDDSQDVTAVAVLLFRVELE
ncbi:MAG: DUF309 domain-containing protein [Planctomycetaceae bacterium]